MEAQEKKAWDPGVADSDLFPGGILKLVWMIIVLSLAAASTSAARTVDQKKKSFQCAFFNLHGEALFNLPGDAMVHAGVGGQSDSGEVAGCARTTLQLCFYLWGPLCKKKGHGCNFYFFQGPFCSVVKILF